MHVLVLYAVLLLKTLTENHAFVVRDAFRSDRATMTSLCISTQRANHRNKQSFGSRTHQTVFLSAQGGSDGYSKSSKTKRKRTGRSTTVADIQKEMMRNPAKFIVEPAGTKRKSQRRTRRRVKNPKQQYTYAALKSSSTKSTKISGEENDGSTPAPVTPMDPHVARTQTVLKLAREMGLPPQQLCSFDAFDQDAPVLIGQLRVGEGQDSSSFAYMIQKPAGWSILGDKRKASRSSKKQKENVETSRSGRKTGKLHKKKQTVRGPQGDLIEIDENDILVLLSPEERQEYEAEMAGMDIKGSEDDNDVLVDEPEDEIMEDTITASSSTMTLEGRGSETERSSLEPQTAENLRKIAARATEASQSSTRAMFDTTAMRPSIVQWLKERKLGEGIPLRGGNFWTALAGAAHVDDSGLVLLCPKSQVDNVFFNAVEYIAVTGNGGFIAPKSKLAKGTPAARLSRESVSVDIVSRLRKNRDDDIVHTVKVTFVEQASMCTSVVEPCQAQFKEGIRGDTTGSPFDRRANRRLIHCSAMSVSSLICDETLQRELNELPDDIAVLAERRNHLEYQEGSFLGRKCLKKSTETTIYREINGAADGFPGWTVDRYNEWLLVSHDPNMPRGPLPSIHDGSTKGVYYLQATPDRSSMGSGHAIVRPELLEGKAAPDDFKVLENGVAYIVSLGRDLSTGIFLDQRPQRAWLARNCCNETRVLNCFAHTGAFSVAAASAGASTVNLDLNRKWLDRFPDHLEANNISYDDRHDCIYGDCFDWLARLAKRGEKYDIVILDPPSSSVSSGKKKRWSVKNDMDELVALAASLVESGGVLWTSTNSASLPAAKFVKVCRKGLVDAGVANAKLERIQAMPSDFPTIGPQAVKNLVWRFP